MVEPVINFLGEFASSKQLIGGGKMRKSAAFLMVLCFLAFGVTAFAESPYLYGIHDHDTGPQEFLDHIANGGATGWVTATVAIGTNPHDTGGSGYRVWLGL